MFLYKSGSVATPEHSDPVPLENYVLIVTIAPDLQSLLLWPHRVPLTQLHYRAIIHPHTHKMVLTDP